ncbi:unnamed protein product [Boreogadus saida]
MLFHAKPNRTTRCRTGAGCSSGRESARGADREPTELGPLLVREGECKGIGPGANRTGATTRQGGRVQGDRTGSQQNSAHYSSGRESARGVDPGANRSGATTRQGGRVQGDRTGSQQIWGHYSSGRESARGADREPTELGPLLVREGECKRSGPRCQQIWGHYSSGRESARGVDPGANRSGATTRQGGRVQEEWTPVPTDLGPLLVREGECKRSGPRPVTAAPQYVPVARGEKRTGPAARTQPR